jgi:hypothetical protein
MVGENSGSNMYEVRHWLFSSTNEVDEQVHCSSNRVVTRRTPSSLTLGIVGVFLYLFFD